jgi:hypothetical protein
MNMCGSVMLAIEWLVGVESSFCGQSGVVLLMDWNRSVSYNGSIMMEAGRE